MEYDINSFTKTLKSLLYDFMPLSSEEQHALKHADRNWHMRDLALGNNVIIPLGTDSQYFEIGNENAEEKAPYYHILQDAQVIRKKGFGTTKSKGSQAFVNDPRKRDSGQVSFTISTEKKTNRQRLNPYYEYRRNVRGSRSLVGNSTQKVISEDGKITKINRESNYYLNIHYDYIGRNLEWIVQQLAKTFNMTLGRTKLDFSEEYKSWIKDYEESLDWGSDT